MIEGGYLFSNIRQICQIFLRYSDLIAKLIEYFSYQSLIRTNDVRRVEKGCFWNGKLRLIYLRKDGF